MNQLGCKNVPFLFIFDYELEEPFVAPLDEINSDLIKYDFNNVTNSPAKQGSRLHEIRINNLIDYEKYKRKFNTVYDHLYAGDSYLLNLTCKTEIEPVCLQDIFYGARAKYKLFYKDRFVFFSPETFVKIYDGKIYTYPMKGTALAIEGHEARARELLLANEKELAEHITVVDLLRNDLSMVSNSVKVTKFRYPELIETSRGSIWQTSSEICGKLPENFLLGDTISALLPAGSVTGAPKKMTCDIIKEAEGIKRGFYTGVSGIFNGISLDSCVIIRYIEKSPRENEGEKYFYRSGGGITVYSDPEVEYKEMVDKIYVPFS